MDIIEQEPVMQQMKTYQELREEYATHVFIPYQHLLYTREWQAKRQEIIDRDTSRCSVCSKGATDSYYNPKTNETIHFWLGNEAFETRKGPAYGEESYLEFFIPVGASKQYTLHVHHKFYILGKLPWEYSNDSLITLCNWCHWKYHVENDVEVFKEASGTLELLNIKPCSRCNGAGGFPEYSHIENGICFKCRGTRFENLTSL